MQGRKRVPCRAGKPASAHRQRALVTPGARNGIEAPGSPSQHPVVSEEKYQLSNLHTAHDGSKLGYNFSSRRIVDIARPFGRKMFGKRKRQQQQQQRGRKRDGRFSRDEVRKMEIFVGASKGQRHARGFSKQCRCTIPCPEILGFSTTLNL